MEWYKTTDGYSYTSNEFQPFEDGKCAKCNTPTFRQEVLLGITNKINEHITLKLINGRTVIYIDDIEFIQCKFLLFTFDYSNIDKYKEIRSMDEAKGYLPVRVGVLQVVP